MAVNNDKEKLGEQLALLEEVSEKVINGKKTDFRLQGSTYKEISKNYKRLFRMCHPDALSKIENEADKKELERIAVILSSAHTIIKNYKKNNNIQDEDKFTYHQEALQDYHRKNKANSKASGKRTNSTYQSKNNQTTRSKSYTHSNTPPPKGDYSNSRNNSSNRNNSKTELFFNNGILKKNLDNENKQKIIQFKDGTKIYGYTFTDAEGQTYEIYSENTFEELSEPKSKYTIEAEMLSSLNLKRANSYDAKKETSQYGYAGLFTQDGIEINEEITKELEERVKKVKAKVAFEKLAARELTCEQALQHLVDERE